MTMTTMSKELLHETPKKISGQQVHILNNSFTHVALEPKITATKNVEIIITLLLHPIH